MNARLVAQGPAGPLQPTEGAPASYVWALGNDAFKPHLFLGHKVRVVHATGITCVACGRSIKKSYQDGYCFPCTQRLASCDLCIVKPERCHFHLGTCREPEWGDMHCMQPHVIYLANVTGPKVGITRRPGARWLEQGAAMALPVATTQSRRLSGLMEVAMAHHVSDKANWRAMLQGMPEPMDLRALRDTLAPQVRPVLQDLQHEFGEEAITWLEDAPLWEGHYPVMQYPQTIRSFNLLKEPVVEDVLVGIKGQYLIFKEGVLNTRKHRGFHLSWTLLEETPA